MVADSDDAALELQLAPLNRPLDEFDSQVPRLYPNPHLTLHSSTTTKVRQPYRATSESTPKIHDITPETPVTASATSKTTPKTHETTHEIQKTTPATQQADMAYQDSTRQSSADALPKSVIVAETVSGNSDRENNTNTAHTVSSTPVLGNFLLSWKFPPTPSGGIVLAVSIRIPKLVSVL